MSDLPTPSAGSVKRHSSTNHHPQVPAPMQLLGVNKGQYYEMKVLLKPHLVPGKPGYLGTIGGNKDAFVKWLDGVVPLVGMAAFAPIRDVGKRLEWPADREIIRKAVHSTSLILAQKARASFKASGAVDVDTVRNLEEPKPLGKEWGLIQDTVKSLDKVVAESLNSDEVDQWIQLALASPEPTEPIPDDDVSECSTTGSVTLLSSEEFVEFLGWMQDLPETVEESFEEPDWDELIDIHEGDCEGRDKDPDSELEIYELP